MTIDVKIKDKSALLTISDRFDSSSYRDFKQAYAPLITNSIVQLIEVDISGLNYLDSAALGMLMQLNEAAKFAEKSITLIGVPGRVASILKMANADKLFTINLPSGMKMNWQK
jgi:HptB-dependent secretion and biofilm anti anti-sigma factor